MGVMDRALGRSKGVKEFEELYRASRDDVYAYVATLLRDRSAAEDVTALAFERAYRKRATSAPGAGVAAGMALRDRTQRGARRAAAAQRAAPAGADPRTTPALAPEDAAETSARRVAVRAALASARARERELIALKFFAGLSNSEIAAVLGTSETNAGTRLHRALHKVREACHETA